MIEMEACFLRKISGRYRSARHSRECGGWGRETPGKQAIEHGWFVEKK